jgi:hypothetical protein
MNRKNWISWIFFYTKSVNLFALPSFATYFLFTSKPFSLACFCWNLKRILFTGFHVDDAEVTLNICLGTQFSGGELFFRGVRCDEHVNTETQSGVCLLFVWHYSKLQDDIDQT